MFGSACRPYLSPRASTRRSHMVFFFVEPEWSCEEKIEEGLRLALGRTSARLFQADKNARVLAVRHDGSDIEISRTIVAFADDLARRLNFAWRTNIYQADDVRTSNDSNRQRCIVDAGFRKVFACVHSLPV